ASFTDDFYQILAKEAAEQNIISSPLSLEIVMAMVYMGAKGNTAKELKTVLKLPRDRNEVAKKYREFFTNLQGREKDAILKLANRIYVNDRLRLVPEYNKIVGDSFKAVAVPINMANPELAAATINSWVSKHTGNKITEIVFARFINAGKRAILVNAMYFKGVWQYEFVKELTRKEDFHTSANQKLEVDMMYLEGSFMADEFPELDAKVLELPYRNSSLFMQIFLPNRMDGLSKLESQIGGFSRHLREQDVYVKIPKFKIEFFKSLTELLPKLGINEPFSGANLSGLVEGNLRINVAVQKGFVEVNEEGAEAAVLTGNYISKISDIFYICLFVIFSMQLQASYFLEICMDCRDEGPRPMIFTADHPFAFLIRDRETIFFQGHFVKP
ncbi:hypothetical protein KR074_008024, partial [Drosophila pseudoananassae]